jgi:hypothetical protein
MTHHVVSLSSGVGSAVAGKRVVEKYGAENVTLLFADVNMEDPDNYRFLEEVVDWIGAKLVVLDNDGKDIWDVFEKEKFLGNTRADPCSKYLKRVPMRKWLEENLAKARPYWEPYNIDAPLCWEPVIWKDQAIEMVTDAGIEPPLLTRQGFPHANCGGGCVKAGHKQFKKLLEDRPEVFKEWEEGEERIRQYLGKDVAILRDRRGGTTKPLTLRVFREGYEGPEDDGSCNCMGYTNDE